MENKFFLRRIVILTLIFGITVFGIEECMLHTTDIGWLFVLAYGMAPTSCVCKLFCTKTLTEMGALNQRSTIFLAANAVLWAIPFAVIYWKILSSVFENCGNLNETAFLYVQCKHIPAVPCGCDTHLI